MMNRIALIALLVAAGIQPVTAGHLVFTVDNPTQSGAPGDLLTYTGLLTYESTDSNDPLLFLNGESIVSPSDYLVSFSTLLSATPNGYLAPGQSSYAVNLFVYIDPDFGTNGTDVFGLNPFDYTLFGGVGWQDLDVLIDGSAEGAHLFFTNVVDPNAAPPGDPQEEPPADPPLTDPNAPEVPEPGTWSLVAGGLGLMVWRRARRGFPGRG